MIVQFDILEQKIEYIDCAQIKLIKQKFDYKIIIALAGNSNLILIFILI